MMNYSILKIAVPAALLMVTSVSVSAGDFAAAWDAADAKRQEAGKIGAEWRDTGKMLKNAKKAAEEGDEAKAMKLVAQALEQSEDAIAQHARESNLWMARVPQ